MTSIIAQTHAGISITSYLYNTTAVSVLLYIAQLVPLPQNFGFAERSAMNNVLHLATNAFTFNTYYSIPLGGGPKLYSASAAALASMFRMSWNTRHIWQAWKAQLMQISHDALPMTQWSNGHFYQEFWDSEPISCNLNHAWLGFPGNKRFSHAVARARDHLLSEPSCETSVQAKAHKCLVQVGFPKDLQAHVSKHFSQFLGAHVGSQGSLDLTECFTSMWKLRKHEAMQVIKTWCV